MFAFWSWEVSWVAGTVAGCLRTSQSTLHTSHTTLRNSHSPLHSPLSTLHAPHFTRHTSYSTLPTSHSTLRAAHSTLHIPHSTLQNPHFTLRSPHSTVHTFDRMPQTTTLATRNASTTWITSTFLTCPMDSAIAASLETCNDTGRRQSSTLRPPAKKTRTLPYAFGKRTHGSGCHRRRFFF